ncbi:MerR family transcriptional regulator [Pseudalkalibacillus hwajinpoensis]|uniref:MerR family transcriptional regulator n=1 Tax=Guptibacillus hwajinpoensis TaxID=208199 RepID=A0A4U1MF90_9BACL|nr:B12-binding domain-containing protein [Pseudalkalibacillus hwajinpoensis]TKD69879.1 MerR family transcriptional regulator [Pseudalkalibacillus hwajinpoensis]
MTMSEGKYNIKAVSKKLGIQPGTLRAWERRYNIISPIRNEAGHRLYSEEHMAILKWLVQKTDQGFTISQAVELLESGNASADSQSMDLSMGQDRANLLADEILEALLAFDESKAQELLNQAFSIFSIDKVVHDILAKLLVRIGDLWEEGKITIAHEHFTSAFLRSRIGMIFHTLPVDGYLPKVMAVCSPGEYHELGLLIFTLYLRRKGFEVIYLGSSIPESDIEVIVEDTDPKILFLSCTLSKNLPRCLDFVDTLDQRFPELTVGLGGHAITHIDNEKRQAYDSFCVGNSKYEWDLWIKDKLQKLTY